MADKYIAPSLGADAFNCPHCGALAHQSWLRTFYARFRDGNKPHLLDEEFIADFEKKNPPKSEADEAAIKWARRTLTKRPFLHTKNDDPNTDRRLENVFASECFSCKEITIWLADSIIYPPSKYEVQPNPDLPDEVKLDFEEASLIADKSPRGAAALLRLGLQKLITVLGGKGKNINEDIADLVKKGLPVQIQQALDIVRVIGNNAVHPGEINLRDDRDTAIRLFGLINMIAEAMITQPKQIAAMFGELPPGALESIEKRDKPKDK